MTTTTGPIIADAIPYDVAVTSQAQDVWNRARDASWPEAGRQAVCDAFWALSTALKVYRNLRNGVVPPWFPGMPAGPEGFAKALRMAAEEAAEKAGELTELLPAASTEGEK